MTKRSTSGLNTVQSLYLVQCDLQKIITSPTEIEDKKAAKDALKNFSSLLKDADPEYMGGEEVYESLKVFEKEAKKKIK